VNVKFTTAFKINDEGKFSEFWYLPEDEDPVDEWLS
jgi:hypothetical protein